MTPHRGDPPRDVNEPGASTLSDRTTPGPDGKTPPPATNPACADGLLAESESLEGDRVQSGPQDTEPEPHDDAFPSAMGLTGVAAGQASGDEYPEAVVAVSDALETSPPVAGDQRRKLALNVAAGGGVNLLKIGVQLVMLPLMAKLLGPAEFGLYALALPTVAFLTALADGGLGASLAREPGTSSLVWSTAFWLLAGIGVLLAVGVSGWGMVLSVVAHQPRLSGLMSFLSITFLFIALSVLPWARLTRQGRLVVFAAADLSSAVIGAVIAVALAVAGAGAWALAIQYVSGFLVRAIVLNAAAYVKPTFEFDLGTIRHHLTTGSSLLGARICDFSGRLIENVLYGRVFGTASLGAFTFANQAPRFICEAASGPVWAALYAHALTEDEARVAAMHEKLVHLLASVVFPVGFLLSASAPELLQMILGPQWSATAILLQIIVPFYALHVVASQSGAVLFASNGGWLFFWLTLALTIGRIGAVAAGPWIGPVGIVIGLGLVHVLFAIGMFWAPRRSSPGGPLPLLRQLIAPATASVVGGGVTGFVLHLHQPTLWWIGASLSIGGITYGLGMLVTEGRQLHRDLSNLFGLSKAAFQSEP